MENFKGMVVDENKEELNISDHNLVKAWFNIGGEIKSSWKKPSYETIQYYKKDVESMKEMEENLVQKIGRKVGFGDIMKKIKIALEEKLKVRKRVKVGRIGDKKY